MSSDPALFLLLPRKPPFRFSYWPLVHWLCVVAGGEQGSTAWGHDLGLQLRQMVNP